MSIRVALALLAAALAGSLVACSESASPISAARPKAAEQVRVVEASAEAAPAGDPWQLVREKCTICHPIDRVTKARKDWAGWSKALDHMSKNGAPLTGVERMRILEYLTNRK